jgi:hypothetical protein
MARGVHGQFQGWPDPGNNAVLALATDGSGTIKARNGTSGTVHLILDVCGYFQ